MRWDKDDIFSAIGTLAFHGAILLILWLTVLKAKVPEEDGGVLVNFGYVNAAAGTFAPRYEGPEPAQEPAPAAPEPTPEPTPAAPEQDLITQDLEESVSLNEKKKEEEEKRRKEEARLERQRRLEEEKKNRGKKKPGQKKSDSDQPGIRKSDSRVGMRTYARGRAYDPNRFGGVTPYHDPNAPELPEDAVEQARREKGEQAEHALAGEELASALPETSPIEEEKETAARESVSEAIDGSEEELSGEEAEEAEQDESGEEPDEDKSKDQAE